MSIYKRFGEGRGGGDGGETQTRESISGEEKISTVSFRQENDRWKLQANNNESRQKVRT